MIKSYTDIQSFIAEKNGLVPPAVISINEGEADPITGYRFTQKSPWTFYKGGKSYISSLLSNPGDIVYVAGTTIKVCSPSDWTSSLGTPIGVIVLPGKMISLNWMNCSTPETGGERQYMYWGENNKVVPNLAEYTRVPTCDPEIEGGTAGLNRYGYMKTDFTGIHREIYEDGNEVNLYYYNENGYCTRYEYYYEGVLEGWKDYDSFIAGPYKFDGLTPNPNFQTPGTAFETLDGKSQTEKIWDAITNKTGAITYNKQSDYPAANCCKRYHTLGTNKGDWYLPSIGELAHLMSNMVLINNSLDLIGGEIIPGFGWEDTSGLYLWSSSQFSSYYAWFCGTFSGYCSGDGTKYGDFYVRAFCAL